MPHRVAHRIIALLLLLIGLPAAAPHAAQATRSAGGVDWRPIVDSDFAGGHPGAWPTGNGGWYDAHVDGGRYTLSVATAHQRVQAPARMAELADGEIRATFRLEGRGRVGLAARVDQTAATAYLFWIDAQGECGGIRLANGESRLLLSLRCSGAPASGDNTLTLRVQGDLLTYMVNGRQLYSYVDRRPLPPGVWGMYVNGAAGATQGHYAATAIIGNPVAPVAPALPTGPFAAVLDSNFGLGNDRIWSTSLYRQTHSHVDQGRYTISVIEGFTQVGTPDTVPAHADGQIAAIVRPEGLGRVGIIGRLIDFQNGRIRSLYGCWVSNTGAVGCTRWRDGVATDLFVYDSAWIKRDADNLLVLRVQANKLTFWLNDRLVSVYRDRQALPSGFWGVYVSSYRGDGPTQGHYARVVMAD